MESVDADTESVTESLKTGDCDGTPVRPPSRPPPVTSGPPIGSNLGRYELLKELGRGGMGCVYLARHVSLDRLVAVKTLSPHLAERGSRYGERFKREARLSARINHPNVVSVTDVDVDEATGVHYLVMEYVEGQTLREMIRKGPVSEAMSIDITLAVARALEQAGMHRIIHRDIKPGNILMSTAGVVKLADLGLGKQLDDESELTGSHATLGTPMYVSPEQLRGSRVVDPRSDIYSLGVTFFQMLTGTLPYAGSTYLEIAEQVASRPVPDPRGRRPSVRPRVGALIQQMMCKEPEGRPASASELIRQLEALKAPEVVEEPSGLEQLIVGAAASGSSPRAVRVSRPESGGSSARPAPDYRLTVVVVAAIFAVAWVYTHPPSLAAPVLEGAPRPR
jgi:serine/threonine protein kinase